MEKLKRACPNLDAYPVTPEDATYFIERICRSPGKPVPFVPVIDENVRKWYCSDALWQAHDDRYDSEQVLIIPGPEAVAGITQADVPVADLMAGYLTSTIEAVPSEVQREYPDFVETALETDVMLLGTSEQANPLPAILKRCGHQAQLAATRTGVRLTVEHPLPVRGSRTLTLDFAVEPFHPFPLRAADNFTERLRTFYRDIMPEEVGVEEARLAAYRRVTQDDGPSVPEQLFFATALPPMMDVILDRKMGLDPLSLLHIRSHIEHLEKSDGGPYEVVLDEPFVQDELGGRRIQIGGL